MIVTILKGGYKYYNFIATVYDFNLICQEWAKDCMDYENLENFNMQLEEAKFLCCVILIL